METLTLYCSRQIRPPIYSLKQSKLRRKRVFRYALLYFILLILFLVLMVGPSLAGKYVPSSVFSMLDSTNLVQPTGLDKNNTIGETETGTAGNSYTGALLTMTGSGSGAAASSTGDAAKIRLF